MARETTKQSTRARVEDPRVRPVSIQEHTRYINARASNNGVRAAEALSTAFRVGSQFADEQIDKRNVAGQERAIASRLTGETRDQEDVNFGYNRAWDQLDADYDLNRVKDELPEALKEFDYTNKSEAQVQAFLTDYFEGNFGGIEEMPNSEYAKAIAPGLLEVETAIVSDHRQAVIDRTRNEQFVKVDSNARDEWAIEMTAAASQDREALFAYDKYWEMTGELFTGPEKKAVFLDTIAQIAVDTGRPDLLTNMPELISGIATKPGTAETQRALQSSLIAAETQRQRNVAAAEDAYKAEWQTHRAVLHANDKQLAEAGDPAIIQRVIDGGEDGPNGEPRLYTRGQQTALLDTYYDVNATRTLDTSLMNDWVTGNGIHYTQSEVDRAANSFVTSEGVQAQIAEMAPEDAEAFKLRAIVALGVTNGPAPLPTWISKTMEVNPNNPEKFRKGLGIYRQIEAQQPGYAKSQISDYSARMMSSYERLVEDYGNEDRAMEALSNIDPTRSTDAKKDIAEAADELATTLNDKPFSLNNYNDPTMLRRTRDEIAHYVDLGYDIDTATKAAERHIRSRYIPIQGRYWSATAGWGEQPEQVAAWAIENEAKHQGVDADDIVIRPHPQNPKLAVIRNAQSALPGYSMPVADITSGYNSFVVDQTVSAAQIAESDKDAYGEAENRAKLALVEDNPFLDSSMRADLAERRETMWDSLTVKEQERLTLQHIKQ